jgi:ubiquinone/menaquinone biosynthesis C-methylase UbiE
MSISKLNGLSPLWKRGYERLAGHFSTMIPDSEDSLILEIGCGRGQLTLPLSTRLRGRIIALDDSPEVVATLGERLKNSGPSIQITTVASDADGLHLGKGSVDCVISNFFLGWVDKEKASRIMASIYEVLREGGVMIHSDFNPYPENSAQAFVLEQGRPENNLDPSVRWWTPDEVCEIAGEKGFKNTEISFFDWDLKFDYPLAIEQLKRWGAKPEFIRERERSLRNMGMELPKSFMVRAVK